MNSEKLNVGIIGLGGRGRDNGKRFANESNIVIKAICDNFEPNLEKGEKEISEVVAGRYTFDTYTDYRDVINRDDISAILVFTTWVTHTQIACDAMKAGKNVGMEVGGAASINECWKLVRTSEETGKFCMLLENCCYDENELTVFNMERQGLFGEIIHTTGGYEHDLREEICMGKETHHGRLRNFMHRNGDLYPTHQLGPIAKLLHINRGNRFVSLTSMSSKAVGLHNWIMEHKSDDEELVNHKFTQGDVVNTMIKCANGETVLLTHGCSLPRPYSRDARVQGTKGIWLEEGEHIYLENQDELFGTQTHEDWVDFKKCNEKFLHPLWKEYYRKKQENSAFQGHGGMDYFVMQAFVEAALNELVPPIDVYDAATWMAVTALSENSIAAGSNAVEFPDFTDGKWIDREPFRRSKYCLEEVCSDMF